MLVSTSSQFQALYKNVLLVHDKRNTRSGAGGLTWRALYKADLAVVTYIWARLCSGMVNG